MLWRGGLLCRSVAHRQETMTSHDPTFDLARADLADPNLLVAEHLRALTAELHDMLAAIRAGDDHRLAVSLATSSLRIYAVSLIVGEEMSPILPDDCPPGGVEEQRECIQAAFALVSGAALDIAFEPLSPKALIGRLSAAESHLHRLALCRGIRAKERRHARSLRARSLVRAS